MNFAGPITALDRPAAPVAPLIDPFARAITYLRVSVTDRCDFRCVYCMAEHMSFLPKAELLTLEELDRLCTAFVAKGVRKLRLTGGEPLELDGDLAGGYYIKPTIFRGSNKMRVFQEEIFGPVVSVTTFKTEAEALEIANDTLYGLGAGVWSRSAHTTFEMGRGIKAGRVWTNCYHQYPAHAAFGGYKQSGIGRENHKMMLDHYQQTKNLLVSYDINPLGFF